MTSEEAQQAPDVVLGMFLTNSYPATILFDPGASHLFISSSFMAKHSMPIATMKHTMLVSSPGGEMRTKHICPAVSISIRGVDFPSNLILLDSKGIDNILGMDWLSKYDGWANRKDQSNLRRYVEGMCSKVQKKLGQEPALRRILIQQ
jgi:hypothetical protein